MSKPTFQGAVLKWLQTLPEIMTLAEGRVYFNQRPSSDHLPALTFFTVYENRTPTLGEQAGGKVRRVELQFDIYATKYLDCKVLQQAIVGDEDTPRLDGYRGDMEGFFVQSAEVTNAADWHERLFGKTQAQGEQAVKIMATIFYQE